MNKHFKLEDLLNAPADNFIDEPNEPDTIAEVVGEFPIGQREESDLLPSDSEIPMYILNDPEIVGYPDYDMQSAIYWWVYTSLFPNSEETKIKDLGCGRGDFGKLCTAWRYFGVDKSELLVRAGKLKYPELNLMCGDWHNFDFHSEYTICIGSLTDDDGTDHYKRFWDTFEYAMRTTSLKVIFVFSTMPGEGHLHFDLEQIMSAFPVEYPFEIDCARFEGICKLTVYCNKFV